MYYSLNSKRDIGKKGLLVSLSSPVVLMVFNRPEKTKRVLDEVVRARPSKLYVVADGPRLGNYSDAELVASTRGIISRQTSELDVVEIYAPENLGLRKRFLSGLDAVFAIEERAIIVEDDCVPSQSFFQFVDEVLQKRVNPKLGIISGSNFAPYKSSTHNYHLSRSPYIWGWGTWADVWQRFREDEPRESWTNEEIQAVLKTFSIRGQAKEFESMMRMAHQLNTWDISFAVWLRQRGLLTAVPSRNLVQNIGFGEGATHTIFENFDVNVPAEELDFPLRHPASLEPDIAREKIMWFTKRTRWLTFPLLHPFDFLGRVIRYLRKKSDRVD